MTLQRYHICLRPDLLLDLQSIAHWKNTNCKLFSSYRINCVCAGAFVCVNSIVTFVESQAGWSDQIQIIEAWGITAKVYPQELPTWVQEFSKLGVVQVVVTALQRLEPLPITASWVSVIYHLTLVVQ
jgi:hypothetical protein